MDVKSLIIAAASGAVGGALAASGIGLTGQIIGNAALGSASEVASQVSSGNKNVKSIALNAAVMGAAGAVAGKFGGAGVRAKGEDYGESIRGLNKLMTDHRGASRNPKEYRHKIGKALKKHKTIKKSVMIKTTITYSASTIGVTWFSHARKGLKKFGKKIKKKFGW